MSDGFEIETETVVLIQNRTETEPIDENPELHSTISSVRIKPVWHSSIQHFWLYPLRIYFAATTQLLTGL